MISIKTLLNQCTKRLQSFSPSPRIDAEVLICFVLQQSKAFLYAHSDDMLTNEVCYQLESLILARIQGIPIAYLVHEKEFWSLNLKVSEHTLIPRPESECLVETALKLCTSSDSCNILELGTGSGAISIAIASECPNWKITALDISHEALAIAKQNAQFHHLDNLHFLQSNWFSNVSNDMQYDLIVSNPPYVAENDEHLRHGDVRFEPKQALISGENGLSDISYLIQHAKSYLKQGGAMLLEHGYQQAKSVQEQFKHAGFHKIHSIHDYSGIPRVTYAYK